jgi:tetratricopeptide (TPR) repeat protein
MAAYALWQRVGSEESGAAYREHARGACVALRASGADSAEAQIALGIEHLLSGDLDGAYHRFHGLSGRMRERREAAWFTAWTALLGGAPQLAEAPSRELAERFPFDPAAANLRGLVLVATDRAAEAIAVARRFRDLWPRLPEGPLLTALAALRAGEVHAALAAAEKALELDPRCAVASRVRVEAHLAAGDVRAALAAVEAAPSAHPGYRVLRGVLLYDLGERERARETFRKCLDAEPRGPEADLARSYLRADAVERREIEVK